VTYCLHEWPKQPRRLSSGTVMWICSKCGQPRTFEHGPVPGTFEEACERFSNAVRNLGEEILNAPAVRWLTGWVRR
jgi:hypothetical protein